MRDLQGIQDDRGDQGLGLSLGDQYSTHGGGAHNFSQNGGGDGAYGFGNENRSTEYDTEFLGVLNA